MLMIYEILVLFLLFPFHISSDNLILYNISLGIPLNITNIKLDSTYIFNIAANYPKILRIKIIIPKDSLKIGASGELFMKEKRELDQDNDYSLNPLSHYSKKNNSDGSVRYLFSYNTYFRETNFCCIKYLSNKYFRYFYILVDLTEPYDLPIGITKTFYNVLEYFYNYFFIKGVERFQRVNITMTLKGTNKQPFSNIQMLEYILRTEDYYDYELNKEINFNNYKILDEIESIYSINFIYDIKLYSTIALSLKFQCDLDYLDIYVEAGGGEIPFYDNIISKNITNLKANYPYYLSTNIVQYQTVLITLFTKFYEIEPFDNVYIYEFFSKYETVYSISYGEVTTNTYFLNNTKLLMISFILNSFDSLYINYIGFQFIPKFDLDYLFITMKVMGGVYYLKEKDFQKIYNIYPNYEVKIYIKSSQYETKIISLKYNYLEKNPLNNVDIYEFKNAYGNEYYTHIKQPIIPEYNYKEYFTNLSYNVENSGTYYVLLKIYTERYLEYLKIEINTHKRIYDLTNNIPIKINDIRPGNLFYFFINATIYNNLFIKFIFNSQNKEAIKYITVNEYKKRNDLLPIKSTNQTFDIINKGNESVIKLNYIPKNSYSKYVAFLIEANSYFDYLTTQVDIEGQYYEFIEDITITKLKAGNIYYFMNKISPVQKIEMNIFIMDNDSININPFNFANIYEKEKIEYNSFNKYYNQSLASKNINGKLIEYFSYNIDLFSTNFILIELAPNMNLEKVQIKFEITKIYNPINNGESASINKLMKNTPYYYFINSKQYQQVNFNLSFNYLQNIPFEFIEIYEFSEKYQYKKYNKFTNKSLEFKINNNNEKILFNSFSYMINSFYTNFIIIKFKPKFEFENLNININVGGGYYDIEKSSIKNISNLIPKYSFYFFTLSSKGDKLNIKLILDSTEIKNPFNTLNILEYSSKNSPSYYLQNSNEKIDPKLKDNKLNIFISYLVKNNSTNFIALEIVPNYYLSSIECLIELEIEDKADNSFSIIKILIITLIGIIIITAIIFIIYIRKICLRTSSIEIENIYKNEDNENKNEKKYELALFPIDPKSTTN